MIGNGCFDWRYDGEPAEMEFLYMHNVIDNKLYSQWRDNECFWSYKDVFPHTDKPECVEAWERKNELREHIDEYDIYRKPGAKDRGLFT